MQLNLWGLLYPLLPLCSWLVHVAGFQPGWPRRSPFFYVCNYHSPPQQNGFEKTEVALSLQFQGNPQFYRPGQFYKVSLTSSHEFDALMLTGLYTMPADKKDLFSNQLGGFGLSGVLPPGQSFMCSMVHSHMSILPQRVLSFIWFAPPRGTGCVTFLATATLGPSVLFKDVTVSTLCEEGGPTEAPPRPDLANIYEHGVILRDDFDSGPKLDSNIWSRVQGGELGDKCGVLAHGKSLVFCQPTGTRLLMTVPLNLTSAVTLQFTMGSGTCSPPGREEGVTVSYGINCDNFKPMFTKRVLQQDRGKVYLVHLTRESRGDNVCLRWYQESPPGGADSSGCLVLDNILVTSVAELPTSLQEDFDPIDPGSWLFFPGGTIQKCKSKGNALVLLGAGGHTVHATTSDLNLMTDADDAILKEAFNNGNSSGWLVENGTVSTACQKVPSRPAAVMTGSGLRKICTTFTDFSEAAVLKFTINLGGDGCHFNRSSSGPITVYQEAEDNTTMTLQVLSPEQLKRTMSVSILVQNMGTNSRICWSQDSHSGQDLDVWRLDNIQVLPIMPRDPEHFIQFGLNLHCSSNHTSNRIVLEFSSDHGSTWSLLFPDKDDPLSQVYRSQFEASDSTSWFRKTLPLPYTALGPFVRFRWRQLTGHAGWAIDNLYIGRCVVGCYGHGVCTRDGCKCDFGYSGPFCNKTSSKLPTDFIELFQSGRPLGSHFERIQGASLNYRCGVLSSNKAAVFYKDGPRLLETIVLNTTSSRFLRFSIQVGSEGQAMGCLGPDDEKEAVLVQSSCDGGITWQTLKVLRIHDHLHPSIIKTELPEAAKGSLCQLRWYQPIHSGAGRDVWALDDVSLTGRSFNALMPEFQAGQAMSADVDVHLGTVGPFCGRPDVLQFRSDQDGGEARYLATGPMQIGPDHMIQFDLAISCSKHLSPHLKHKISLEFSVDHGMHWELVRDDCHPPNMCSAYDSPSIFEAPQFKKWRRVTVLLEENTWSPYTRFRFRQSSWTPSDSWGITHLLIGQSCPDMCHGHGQCVDGKCICDAGYHGDTCIPSTALPSSLKENFSRKDKSQPHWLEIHGGDVVGPEGGCGTILSGESLYFSQNGFRSLVTNDLDLRSADYVQFYIQVGGPGNQHCRGADRRSEGVLVQHSSDCGATWKLVKELDYMAYKYPRFVHLKLSEDLKKPISRLRWWQPTHSGQDKDQWAVDDVMIGRYSSHVLSHKSHSIDFNVQSDDPGPVSHWMMTTDLVHAKFCHSDELADVFSGSYGDKVAVTHDLELTTSDVIQFQVNVGCSQKFSYEQPVRLEFSTDSGLSWQLVQEACYLGDSCQDGYLRDSIFHTGTYGTWRMVVIPVRKQLTDSPVNIRWIQAAGGSSFALKDIYIGQSCPNHCGGQGLCQYGHCVCLSGFSGSSCQISSANPKGFIDRFDGMNEPKSVWGLILGGVLGEGCGVITRGRSLYFSGEGHREAVTVPLDLADTKILQFSAKIGNKEDNVTCRRPRGQRSGVIVDFSKDNGLTWHLLKVLDPMTLSNGSQVIQLLLPSDARGNSTVLRWWQQLSKSGVHQTEWALDDVVVAMQDVNPATFEDNFKTTQGDVWYMIQNGQRKASCGSKDKVLEFSENGGQRFLESWDFQVHADSFLQFDLAMGCSRKSDTPYTIYLEYSTDMGKSWSMFSQPCSSVDGSCTTVITSSAFVSSYYGNWTRIMLPTPTSSISPSTRFRWKQQVDSPRRHVWALDNVYLGNGCMWMCSGHGYCKKGKCLCDRGYKGPYCVAAVPLPTSLKDEFDGKLSATKWPTHFGGSVSDMCGVLSSGSAFVFFKDGLRLFVSEDLDTTMATYIQFMFKYGCVSHHTDWPREHMVLLQYSSSGGVIWHTLQEIHFHNTTTTRFMYVPLPPGARTNATRYRFLQPQHGGHMHSKWAVDDVFIGNAVPTADSIYLTFDLGQPDQLLFWPGASAGEYCSNNTRFDSGETGRSAMVMSGKPGEHAVYTTDITISDFSVVQFSINIGCSSSSSHHYPVHLEYSMDHGLTWHLVVKPCTKSAGCSSIHTDPSVYYEGTTPYWQRVTIPMADTGVCGVARFRWYQGYFTGAELDVPHWAVDNIYIGPQCQDHCQGHGACISGLLCQCDSDHILLDMDTCVPTSKNPDNFKETFDEQPGSVIDRKWTVSGAAISSDDCGTLSDGNSLIFNRTGVRQLVTRDLDLTGANTVQFYIQLGCTGGRRLAAVEPVSVQYSNSGGIHWTVLQEYDYDARDRQPQYKVVTLPEQAKTDSTRLRWVQVSQDGSFHGDWALDQIYIGGILTELVRVAPDQNDFQWAMSPGVSIQTVCQSKTKVNSFTGPGINRAMVTADLMVTEQTFLQFDIAVGCSQTRKCYGIELQYSTDHGQTWNLVRDHCAPSDVDCETVYRSSIYTADTHHGWQRVTVQAPPATRSGATRFRLVQQPGFLKQDVWALGRVYVGDACPSRCGGHGFCNKGECICDDGWSGTSCSEPSTTLHSGLKDMFTEGKPRDGLWSSITGAKKATECGKTVSHEALHFKGVCTRELVTYDLDLRNATFVQFYFMFGCTAPPAHRDEGVLVSYSTTGGDTWTTLTELSYDKYRHLGFVTLELPPEARYNGVRLKWWQLQHPGTAESDWVIDDVIISGRNNITTGVKDNFTNPEDSGIFIMQTNIGYGEYCDKAPVLMSLPVTGEDLVLMTTDINLQKGDMIQFSLSVGCNRTGETHGSPVHLEYSSDSGKTWHLLREECLPYNANCTGPWTMASTYYSHTGWRRETIVIHNGAATKSSRLRWIQRQNPKASSPAPVWAISELYIGPSCPGQCQGHGWCDYPQCVCDVGYSGELCRPDQPNPTFLKDTLSDDLDATRWSFVQGGMIGPVCSPLTSGHGLHFTGSGQRLAETTDFDLRGARYIQFTGALGGHSLKAGCGDPTSQHQNILVQFSTNGGVIWTDLHMLDYTNYVDGPHVEYIPIPPSARTASTRVRWWQKSVQGALAWTLSEVYIGGFIINPSELQESFSDSLDETMWGFYPMANITTQICGGTSPSLSWRKGQGYRHVTTQQMIIQENFIIQFKIRVGCGTTDQQCNSQQAVWLMYNKQPLREHWQLLEQPCVQAGLVTESDCKPYQYHYGTTYTASSHGNWTRITVRVPPKAYSSHTRLRWAQQRSHHEAPAWAIDSVFVGEACPLLCNGRGDCRDGKCHCDHGYHGATCSLSSNNLYHMTDGFEAGISALKWERVSGASISNGCGTLRPYAHGKSLYFNGCGVREAITRELDVSRARKVMFVLRIGHPSQSSSCNVDLVSGTTSKHILLQYTVNKGIDWPIIASHDPKDFLRPHRVSYDIPVDPDGVGVQLRWWQPRHGGPGKDQWAIDHVEIVNTRPEPAYYSPSHRGYWS